VPWLKLSSGKLKRRQQLAPLCFWWARVANCFAGAEVSLADLLPISCRRLTARVAAVA